MLSRLGTCDLRVQCSQPGIGGQRETWQGAEQRCGASEQVDQEGGTPLEQKPAVGDRMETGFLSGWQWEQSGASLWAWSLESSERRSLKTF